MNYSPEHCAAFKRFQQVGSVALSERDLELIEKEDPEHGAYIRKRRREVQAAAAPAVQPTAPPKAKPDYFSNSENVKTFATAWRALFEGSPEQWNALVQKHGMARVPLIVLSECVKFMLEMNHKNKERNARLEAVENGGSSNQRAADVEMRLRAVEDRLEKSPPMTYRETWEPATAYQKGDSVTWDGSMWCCRVGHSNGREPGKSDYWKCSVMRGRQGKQGESAR